jgi:predicted aldo/keto reductase-like oxidoreductase
MSLYPQAQEDEEMQYRKLGKKGVDVSIIGLGSEYLEHAPLDTIASVINTALDEGVNYIDLFMASPDVRDNFGIALKDRRQRVMVAGHLGSTLKNGQPNRSRDSTICEYYFNDLLTRLQTDYIDILMLFFVDEADDYDKIFGPGGLLELARRLQKEGKARFIGMSSHRVPSALKAVNSGYIDVLMLPINPAIDTLPGDIAVDEVWQASTYRQPRPETDLTPSRRELHHACAANGVAVAAMKPYAAGWLFNKKNPSGIVLTPVQCLSYALSQPGVCTTVPGCRTANEMRAALAYLEATDEEKDYSAIDTNTIWKLQGSCMYCNHCLPCPVSIDIGTVTRLTDTARYAGNNLVVTRYESLQVTASACTECGVCAERCPFNVDVIANMKQAVAIFGR